MNFDTADTNRSVLDVGQVKPALVGGDIGNVTDLGFDWPCRREGLFEQVRRYRIGVFRVRRRLESPFLFAAQTKLPPQPRDPVTSSVKSLHGQFRLHAQRSMRRDAACC